jgi:hypothetical protein
LVWFHGIIRHESAGDNGLGVLNTENHAIPQNEEELKGLQSLIQFSDEILYQQEHGILHI